MVVSWQIIELFTFFLILTQCFLLDFIPITQSHRKLCIYYIATTTSYITECTEKLVWRLSIYLEDVLPLDKEKHFFFFSFSLNNSKGNG